ncbi:MAG: type III secretion protein V [Psychrobacter glaciei]|jgi:type III secretion protein V
MNNRMLKILTVIGKRNDIFLAVLLIAIIFMMILPLSTIIIDVLIALNIGISVTLLMLAIYIRTPLELSAFPSLLLLTTLFRLALSITTTRLILLQADAGDIIYTFGNFVVGGNLIVGLVIFLIITIVQFLVITKGSERVAEVSARFSLDAMPGKQMSIDGDMRAGVIEVDEARKRRAMIEQESQLYGSMDGAMKFVKGDAIAGIIIIIVNILGGISIGVFQNDLSTSEALEIYSILTIGDGLIAQIPALLIAMTAGFIVTRVPTGNDSDLGNDIGFQVIRHPKALMIGGALLFTFALIPGFPTFTFISLALLIGGGGFILQKRQATSDEEVIDNNAIPAMAPAGSKKTTPPSITRKRLGQQEEFTYTLPLLIDVSADLETYLPAAEINEHLLQVRRALYLDLGVPFPGMHLRFNENLSKGEYRVLVHEIPIVHGYIYPNKLMVTEKREQLEIVNIPYEILKNQLPGIDPLWVDMEHKDSLTAASIEFMEPSRVLIFHFSFVLKRYAEEFIGIQETRHLLEQMEGSFPELVKEVQRLLPLQKISEIFQRLVSEDISIRNLRSILESLVEWGQKEKDTVLLTEYVRGTLKRHISYKYSNGLNILPAYLLDQSIEETIREGIRQTSSGAYLALDPSVTSSFTNKVKEEVGDIRHISHKPVLVVSMDIRRYVRKLLELDLYDMPILSYQELTPEINIQPINRICMPTT